MSDLNSEMTRTENQMLLIRVLLGLDPAHDPVEAVRILHDKGREEFERVRGQGCYYAAEWRPSEN